LAWGLFPCCIVNMFNSALHHIPAWRLINDIVQSICTPILLKLLSSFAQRVHTPIYIFAIKMDVFIAVLIVGSLITVYQNTMNRKRRSYYDDQSVHRFLTAHLWCEMAVNIVALGLSFIAWPQRVLRFLTIACLGMIATAIPDAVPAHPFRIIFYSCLLLSEMSIRAHANPHMPYNAA